MRSKIISEAQKRGISSEPPAPTRNLGALSGHIERCMHGEYFVLHEAKSSVIHLDVHVVRPSKQLPFWTLVTSGMSDLAMDVPVADYPRHIELAICLPPAWPLSLKGERWKEEEFFWPIAELKSTAMYPHLYKTWLGPGHSIELTSGKFAGGRFAGHLIHRLQCLPEEFAVCKNADDVVEIFGLIPLLPEEITYKTTEGLVPLQQRLRASGVTELLDPKRKAVCPIH